MFGSVAASSQSANFFAALDDSGDEGERAPAAVAKKGGAGAPKAGGAKKATVVEPSKVDDK